MDEAVGKPVEPVPFRAVTSIKTGRRRRARRRAGRALTFVVIVAVCVTALYFVRGFPNTQGGASGRSSHDLTIPPTGKGESRHRLLAAPIAPTEIEGARYRFLQHQHDSKKPITWDPCRPIHYVVRPDHAPIGGSRLV